MAGAPEWFPASFAGGVRVVQSQSASSDHSSRGGVPGSLHAAHSAGWGGERPSGGATGHQGEIGRKGGKLEPCPNPGSGLPARVPRDHALYTEKLWPNVWVWLIIIGLSAAGILILAPISMLAGYLPPWPVHSPPPLLLTSTPRITVTGASLQVGRAHD